MQSMLVSPAVIPIWDADLVHDLCAVERTRGSGSSSLRISVLNDEGQVYREILGEDISEYAALLGRLATLGFEVVAGGDGVQMQWQRTTPFSREWPRERR